MKKLLFLVLVFLIGLPVNAQNISPQFSELKGMVDSQGMTHLLYRIYSHESDSLGDSGNNDIYNLVPGTSIDELFLSDYYFCSIYMGMGHHVSSYDFWNNDFSKFIYCGMGNDCFCPSGYISRYDSIYVYNPGIQFLNTINISGQNDSLVYAGQPVMRSTDGGFSWEIFNDSLNFVSLFPFDDNIFFASGAGVYVFNTRLYKTTNGGSTFSLIDTVGSPEIEFYYDPDGQHIYTKDTYILKRSASQGNVFTWENIFTANSDFYISLDQSQSGAVYLASGKRIYYSSDYGTSFSFYKELDNNIVGIYKKPASDKLYAATKYKIYEITNNSITVIKSIPAPEEFLAFYSLKVGSKWIYDYLHSILYPINEDIFYREVISEKIQPNGKKYFAILEKYMKMGLKDTVYERIDSLEGKIYRYEAFCPNSEQLIEDLLMDVNDSTFATRFGFCIEHPPTVLTESINFNKWGFKGKENRYLSNDLITINYHLLTDIGLDYFKFADDNGYRIFTLKGMIKNGIVYGDTTLTGVDDENNIIPAVYKLEQNFPNPFNPVTKIRWHSPFGGQQTLKVFDILGNEIAVLVDEYREAGIHETEFNASKFPSGVYFYDLTAGSFHKTCKMILIK